MPNEQALQRAVLDLVADKNYRPVKPATIAKKLDLDEDQLRDLKRAIKKLVKNRQLTWGPKHRVMKGATPVSGKALAAGESPVGKGKAGSKASITGTFRKASAGYGFVTPSEVVPELKGADVFIPASKTADAADGDTVEIKFSKSGDRGKRGKKTTSPGGPRYSGRIVKIVERRTHRFVGTYLERGGFGLVRVDGGVFEHDILVGDAGAKNGRPGDKVVIEMVNFPSSYDEGEGVIVEILGPRGKAGVDTLSIIHEFNLPGEFSEEVLADARAQAETFDDETIPDERTDFTKTTVVTIDPATARDFDDAISLEQLDNGHWRLGVHIADVSHFVPPRSALDDEAYARATSVYLPDKVIPMLPEIVSNNLASLQPNRNRYTTTAVIEFTADGAPVATELHRGVINSAHRFNYEEIDDYLADDRPWKKKLTAPVFELVRRMHTLAMILRRRRMDRGAIELTLPEVKIVLDEEGRACGAKQVEHTESHQIIEEFMLAANEAVAREMVDRGLYLVRRIHENPSPVKLKELTTFVQGVGIDASNLQDRFELKRVVAAAEGLPEEHAIHFAVLRAMQKAIYSPKEEGHYALASKAYCHFTSPIRRYPDLVIHRMCADLIAGKRPKSDFDRLTQLGNHCSQLEQRAEQAERNLIRCKLLNLLLNRRDDVFPAIIQGVESFGMFVQLSEIPVDGLIPIASLPEDRYEFERDRRMLSGRRTGNQFRMGDRVHVRITAIDPEQRELELELVQHRRDKKRSSSTRKPSRTAGRSGVTDNADRKTKRKTNRSNKPVVWGSTTKKKPSTKKSTKKSKSKKSTTRKKQSKTSKPGVGTSTRKKLTKKKPSFRKKKTTSKRKPTTRKTKRKKR